MPETDKNAVVASMTTSTPYLLKDTRDNQTYTVAKLADGKVWMLDNLNLDLTDSTVVNKLSQYNTNATNTIIGYLKNGGRANGAQYPTAGVANWTTNNSYSVPLVSIGGTCYTSTVNPCTYSGTYTRDSLLSALAPDSVFGKGTGKIGVCYNYCAASAGSYCYGDADNAGTSSGDATYDVCPNAWRMPTGGESGEYQTLCTILNKNIACTNDMNMTATNTDSIQYQLSVTLSGYYDSGHAWQQGTRGQYWSSSRHNSTYAYGLMISMSDLQSKGTFNRLSGKSVRCILN